MIAQAPRGAETRALLCNLFTVSILCGCAGVERPLTPHMGGDTEEPTVAAAPATPSGLQKAVADMEALKAITVAPLTPDEALDERHIGKRVRWAGGVHHMTGSDKGYCLTILYARSGDNAGPHWTAEPTYQNFDACMPDGLYDPELVHDFTNVTIVGRITGKTHIGMGGGGSPGPVVAIERLYRWSDCLSGDRSFGCQQGFLISKPAPEE